MATLYAAPVCNCPVDSSGSRAQHGFRKYLPNSSYLIIKRNIGRRWRSRKGYYTTQAQRLHTRGMLRNRSVLRTPPSSLTCRLPVYNTQIAWCPAVNSVLPSQPGVSRLGLLHINWMDSNFVWQHLARGPQILPCPQADACPLIRFVLCSF